ncbi:MAG TPA: MarR family winged helix-turn-helix transcriptional regulator [Deltaproteobacteria bacterium]|mgnify:CR=1 FL=1|nr:MarR family winged helix-turn-helix transcriptional regulator [Deltaproteobacteria bacterium]
MWPEIDPRDREVLDLIMGLSKAVRCCRQDEVFCEDVTFTQFLILDRIAGRTELGMVSLHAELGVDKSTTTRLVAPLLRRGLIARERAGHDSRAVVLTLTARGKAVHARVWQCLADFVRAIQAEIPARRREGVLKGAGAFLQAMQQVADRRYAGNNPARCCAGASRHRRGSAG